MKDAIQATLECIGILIQNARFARSLSIEKAAEELSMPAAELASIEKGLIDINLETLVTLKEFYDLKWSELFRSC